MKYNPLVTSFLIVVLIIINLILIVILILKRLFIILFIFGSVGSACVAPWTFSSGSEQGLFSSVWASH